MSEDVHGVFNDVPARNFVRKNRRSRLQANMALGNPWLQVPKGKSLRFLKCPLLGQTTEAEPATDGEM